MKNISELIASLRSPAWMQIMPNLGQVMLDISQCLPDMGRAADILQAIEDGKGDPEFGKGVPITDDFIKPFEARFAAVEHTNMYRRDLVMIGCGGWHPDGESDTAVALDKDTAMHLWYHAAVRYANAVDGTTLIWREKPEVAKWTLYNWGWSSSPEGNLEKFPIWKCYSRLAVVK